MALSPCVAICEYDELAIANGASLSAAFNCAGHVLVAVLMPAAWTAASLTFQGSHDGVTYYNIYDAQTGAELAVTTTAGAASVLYNPNFIPFKFIKVRSGTAGSPVAQAAGRTLVLAFGKPSTAT